MIKLQFASQIESVNAKADKTLSIKIGTQELSPDDASYLLSMMGNVVWVGIAETEIKSLEVPDVIPEFKGEKSPSQRLKAIIYVLWKEKTDQKEAFPRYYDSYLSKIIEQLKTKLD
jgi:hypothetical protein